MANVFDVAKHILKKEGKMTAMKLQKLCYYSQAWHLVWEEKRLFDNEIQAWENGPVSPDLYQWHKGQFIVERDALLDELCMNNLKDNEEESIDSVLRDYRQYTAQQLSDLTHQEKPWRETYNKYKTLSGRCDAEISINLMHEFYSGLLPDNVEEE